MREYEEQRLVTVSFLDELYEEVRVARAEVERLRLVLLAKLEAEELALARRGEDATELATPD